MQIAADGVRRDGSKLDATHADPHVFVRIGGPHLTKMEKQRDDGLGQSHFTAAVFNFFSLTIRTQEVSAGVEVAFSPHKQNLSTGGERFSGRALARSVVSSLESSW